MKICKKYLKNNNVYIAQSEWIDNKVDMKILNSTEEFNNRKKSSTKKLERLNNIDKGFSNEGLAYILQPLTKSDIMNIIPHDETEIANVGAKLIEVIGINCLIKKGNIKLEELEKMKSTDIEEYDKLLKSVSPHEYLSELGEEIKKNARFIDIDKMICICIYRLENYVESDKYDPEKYEQYKQLIFYTLYHLKDNKHKFRFKVLMDKDKFKEIEYSYKDINSFYCRLTEKGYISKKEISEIKNNIKSGKILLKDVDNTMLDLLDFTNEELDEIIKQSSDNIISVIEICKLDEKDIMEVFSEDDELDEKVLIYIIKNRKISVDSIITLYSEGKIKPEFFKKFSEEIDISSEINLKEITDKYHKLREEKKDSKEYKKIEQRLEAMLDIYIAINIGEREEKTNEELEEISDKVMDEIAEDFEDEQDLLFYYKKGLITLKTVAELCGENLIENMYNQGDIKIEDLERIKNKIKPELLEKVILNEDLSFEQLLEYIKKKYISKHNILNIFKNSDIYRVDLEKAAKELLNLGIVSKYTYTQLIQRDLENLEEKAGHGFSKREPMKQLRGCEIPWEIQISKTEMRKHFQDNNDNIDKTNSISNGGKSNKIISPRVRYEFLKLLQCNIPNIQYEKIGENNPFYHYNFYIIQEEILGEEPQRDAIIVIERFFKNREKAMNDANGDIELALENVNEWSRDNATYIMNYEDYLVLQGKQKELQESNKRKVVKEVDGAIYTANHRSKSWAASLLYKIAQSKSGKSFKEYKGDERTGQVLDWLRTLYTVEELDKIVYLAKQIDDEKFTYEEKNGTYKLVDTGYDYSDDSEER